MGQRLLRSFGIFGVLVFVGGSALAQNSLTFTVKKPAYDFLLTARDNPLTIRRTYGSEIIDLSLQELIDIMPAQFVAGDYLFYAEEPIVIERYRLVFQHDTAIIAIDQIGCLSNELVMVVDRMKTEKEFFITEILVRNTGTDQKYYLSDVVLQFQK
jgi:hypothetical protein